MPLDPSQMFFLEIKFLIMDFNLTDTDYLSFIRRKEVEHDELTELTDLTQGKIKQVIFKILEQGGIIESIKSKEIQLQILEGKTKRVIVDDNPEWLKIFLNIIIYRVFIKIKKVPQKQD